MNVKLDQQLPVIYVAHIVKASCSVIEKLKLNDEVLSENSSDVQVREVTSTRAVSAEKLETEELKNFLPPERHKGSLVVWTDLTLANADRLIEATGTRHLKKVLRDILKLDESQHEEQQSIILELFHHIVLFAQTEKFSRQKLSALFSITKRIFDMCIETPFRNKELTQEYFRELLVCHSIHHPPYSVAIFSDEDVLKISQYTTNSFFRHFDMYKYTFTSQVVLDVELNYTEESESNSSGEGSQPSSSRPQSSDSTTQTPELLSSVQEEQLKAEIMDRFSQEEHKLTSLIQTHMSSLTDYLVTHLVQLASSQRQHSLPAEDPASLKMNEDHSGVVSPKTSGKATASVSAGGAASVSRKATGTASARASEAAMAPASAKLSQVASVAATDVVSVVDDNRQE